MKILLLGRDGQVGWELERALAPLGTLVALGRAPAGTLGADLSDLDALARTIRETAPDVIVNAAAYTAVDDAEDEPERARRINAEAPEVLAREAAALRAVLVHYSTDYVFDGSGEAAWRETDTPAPLNTYGATKLAGEEAIRASDAAHLILRTSWVYSTRRRNFIRSMLRLAAQREKLQLVHDQIGAPTGAELIADVTAHALRHAASGAAQSGTYHLAAAGETSWHAYATFVIERARELGATLEVREIEPIPSAGFPTRAARPANSRLDCAALEAAFGLSLPDWRTGVARTVSELVDAETEG